MAISKQQEAIIAKIVSYNPATWLLACESEAVKIPGEDRAEFGKILLEAMDVYKSKVQNVIPILKRGPNLNPEANIRAWGMMHARFLARLFMKHPTLCERLCVKLSNETYNPGWRCHAKKLKEIEEHKGEIEEQVEAACRESQLFFSTHSGSNFVITNHSNFTDGSQSKPQDILLFEAKNRKKAAGSLLACPQSDEAQCSHEPNFPNHMPPLQVHSGHTQTTASNSKFYIGKKQPKHVRFALALEKSAAAELEAISRIEGNSFYCTPQEKAHQLHLERNLQARIAFQNDPSDDQLDRPTSAKRLSKRKRVATHSNAYGTVPTKLAVIPDSDIGDKQLTSKKSDGEIRNSHNRKEVGSRQNLSLSNIQRSSLSEDETANLSLGIEEDLENSNSSPAESVNGDNDELFSLREMIDAMEFVAEHPWICEHLLVDHVWDEYKIFHEYNTEALKVAEEEIEEFNRAAAKEATLSTHKGTEVDSSIISVHRTRSMSQTSRSPSVLPSRLASLPRFNPSVCQADPTDEANANKTTAAEEDQEITETTKARFGNRDFQNQVATVYRALGVVPTVTGPVTFNHAPLHRVQSSGSSAPTNNSLPRRVKSSDRSSYQNNQPKRRSRLSKDRRKTAQAVVDGDTIIIDTSPRVPAHVYSIPDYIAPPLRGQSFEALIPAYAAPRRRAATTAGEDQEIFAANQTRTEPEMAFAAVGFPGQGIIM